MEMHFLPRPTFYLCIYMRLTFFFVRRPSDMRSTRELSNILLAHIASIYSILFYSILFYSILFYSILFYSILFDISQSTYRFLLVQASLYIVFISRFFLPTLTYFHLLLPTSTLALVAFFSHDPAWPSYNPSIRPPHDHATVARFHAFTTYLHTTPPHDPRTSMLPCHRETPSHDIKNRVFHYSNLQNALARLVKTSHSTTDYSHNSF